MVCSKFLRLLQKYPNEDGCVLKNDGTDCKIVRDGGDVIDLDVYAGATKVIDLENWDEDVQIIGVKETTESVLKRARFL